MQYNIWLWQLLKVDVQREDVNHDGLNLFLQLNLKKNVYTILFCQIECWCNNIYIWNRMLKKLLLNVIQYT